MYVCRFGFVLLFATEQSPRAQVAKYELALLLSQLGRHEADLLETCPKPRLFKTSSLFPKSKVP